MNRDDIRQWHIKSVTKAEQRYAKQLQTLFADQVREIVKGLRKLSPKSYDQQAESILAVVYDPKEWNEELFRVSTDALVLTMAEGAAAELLQHDIAFKMLQARKVKTTQAQEFIDAYDYEVPPGLDFEPPEWFVEAAKVELRQTFAQDYWQRINVTTRQDIARTLANALEYGASMTEVAADIMAAHGDEYTHARAMNVARTETGGAQNAGHRVALEHLEDEVGFLIGKQWLSVLGSTTRDTHAALDGETVEGAAGEFDVGGTMAPEPGHWRLPVEQRANCQCTIISDIIDIATEGG